MRPIDADAVCERCRKSGAICTGSDCEIPTMPTLTPPNEPLSWAELTKMYGEPVYIVVMGVCEYWALVKYAYNGGVYLAAVNDIDDYGSELLYGKTWLAYRRPPERQEDT